VVRLATKYNYSTIMWDNGADLYDRATNTWLDPVVPSIITNAVRKVSNALADSTTDASALTQSTSAYLFHKVGDPVVAQSVTYLLNGNTLRSVSSSSGKRLTSAQYSITSTGSFTLSASYLSTLITNTTTPGVLETLTLTFTPGTFLTLTIIQYSVPTVSQSTYPVGDATTDLHIPVSWNNGIHRPAAVKIALADGSFPIDSWTIYLPELQHGRITYNGNWNFEAAGLIVPASTLSTIKSGGQDAVVTIEAFPRDGDKVGSNAVNVTITV
jgi:endoglucanase